MLKPFTERWAMLLRTRKRDGSWVERIRNFEEVEITPCTPRGRPVGATLEARARRLDGDEAEEAERLLRRRYPVVYGLVVPLELRVKRARAG